jgi:hypothetical protein
METESDEEVECNLSTVEIADELCQHFVETKKRREEPQGGSS